VGFGALYDFPEFTDDFSQEVEVTLLGGDGKLPVPLVDVGGVVVVEEVVLADCAHICQQTFADIHTELFQGHSFPFCGGLDELGADGFVEAEAAGELDWCTGAVAVEEVVDAGFDVDDEGDGDADEVELFAEVLLDVVFDGVGGDLSFLGRQQ